MEHKYIPVPTITLTPRALGMNWGIADGPWLWSIRLKILFVLDGGINLSRDPSNFGLGQVVQTLRDRSFAWWVRFCVDVAIRDGSRKTIEHRDHRYSPTLRWTEFRGFEFNQPGFSLDDYDQVWLFGYWPGNPGVDDTDIYDPENKPLKDSELRVLAQWMDRGGGVFATGDHTTLGASMCSRIPRVRSMRKWTHAQGVPAFGDEADPERRTERHETLVHAPDTFDPEGDQWPQRIYPVHQSNAHSGGPFPFPDLLIDVAAGTRVHPLLCGPRGPIRWFPDHMHEGEVVEDGLVDLDRPLNIPGYNRPEYPLAIEGDTAQSSRPVPRVIAYGLTTNLELQAPKRFALIGAYDGDLAGIGRVVVDSTWHHWFSMNLVGFETDNRPVYENLQAYYRNVALWLATPVQRRSMLTAAAWGAVTGSSPMIFHRAMGAWEVGMRAVDVIGRSAPQCIIHEMVLAFTGPVGRTLSSASGDLEPGEPTWSSIPTEVVDRTIVGSIGKSLLNYAIDYQEQRARGERSYLDAESVSRLAATGTEQAVRLLARTADKAAAEFQGLSRRLRSELHLPPEQPIPVAVEVAGLRIVADRLQIPDSTDPALQEEPLTVTTRVFVDENVIAHSSFELVEIPPGGRGIELEQELTETAVQSGERLTIEVLAGAWSVEDPGPEPLRFTNTHHGDPSTWMGRHRPDRKQEWRFWYRIEPWEGTRDVA